MARKISEHCLRMTHRGKSGHVGSMLSMADLLSVLCLGILKVDPKNPRRPARDRFVLSQGHGGADDEIAALGVRSLALQADISRRPTSSEWSPRSWRSGADWRWRSTTSA